MYNQFIDKNSLVDLHIHTCASDGTSTPMEIIQKAKQSNLRIISITDHDSMESLEIADKIAQNNNIILLKGIEISTRKENMYYHVLGYNFALDDNYLKEICNYNKKAFEEKDSIFVDNLIKNGFDIDKSKYISFHHDPKKGGWKVLNFLINENLCNDIYSFLETYTPGNILPYAELIHPKKAIESIKHAGGFSVLAHPGSYISNVKKLHTILNEFLGYGIQGIECYTYKNSKEVTNICLEFCKKNHLFITGGSDYHGKFDTEKKNELAKILFKDLYI